LHVELETHPLGDTLEPSHQASCSSVAWSP
jgi:hypothetical protein